MKFLIRSYDLIYLINGSTTKPPHFMKKKEHGLIQIQSAS
jgi:hypothetical protein